MAANIQMNTMNTLKIAGMGSPSVYVLLLLVNE